MANSTTKKTESKVFNIPFDHFRLKSEEMDNIKTYNNPIIRHEDIQSLDDQEHSMTYDQFYIRW